MAISKLNYHWIGRGTARSTTAKHRGEKFVLGSKPGRHLLLALFDDDGYNPKDATALKIVPDAFVDRFIDQMRSGSGPGLAFAKVFEFFNTEIRDESELSIAALHVSENSTEITVATQGCCTVFVRDASGKVQALPIDTVQNPDELKRLQIQHRGKFILEEQAGILFNTGDVEGTRLTRCIGAARFSWMGREPRIQKFNVNAKSWVLLTEGEIFRTAMPSIEQTFSRAVASGGDRLRNLLCRIGKNTSFGLLWRNG